MWELAIIWTYVIGRWDCIVDDVASVKSFVDKIVIPTVCTSVYIGYKRLCTKRPAGPPPRFSSNASS